MSSLSYNHHFLLYLHGRWAPGAPQSLPAEGATSHRLEGRSILGPQLSWRGREEQEKKREEAAGFRPSPRWWVVPLSMEFGQWVFPPWSCILRAERVRHHWNPGDRTGWDTGEAEQQATPSTRADGATSRPTPCLPISEWNWWKETESR